MSQYSFVFLCLPSFVSRCLPAWMPPFVAWMPGTVWVDGFMCLPSFVSRCLAVPGRLARLSGQVDLSPFICRLLSPSLDAWHGSVSGRIHLSFCLPLFLYLAPVGSQPGCLARLSGWTDSFVSHCLSAWTGSFVSLYFVSFLLSPSLDAWHGSLYLSPLVTEYAVYSAGRRVCLRLRSSNSRLAR